MIDAPRLLPHSFLGDHLGGYLGFALDTEPEDGLRALFTFETAATIAKDYALLATGAGEPPREAFYDVTADTFAFFDPATREWLSWSSEEVGGVRFYAIGDGAWTWRPVGGTVTGSARAGSVGE